MKNNLNSLKCTKIVAAAPISCTNCGVRNATYKIDKEELWYHRRKYLCDLCLMLEKLDE